jgi:hypothetical protein
LHRLFLDLDGAVEPTGDALGESLGWIIAGARRHGKSEPGGDSDAQVACRLDTRVFPGSGLFVP